MRRISRQKKTLVTPCISHQCVEAVTGLSPEFSVLGSDPRRQKFPCAFWCGDCAWIFSRVDRNFPTAVVARTNQVSARPLRVAILHAGCRQLSQSFFIDQNVHHQPRFVEIQILQTDSSKATHCATGSVAANHILRFYRRHTSVISLQGQSRYFVVLF